MIIRASFLIAATVTALAISARTIRIPSKKQKHERNPPGDAKPRGCEGLGEEKKDDKAQEIWNNEGVSEEEAGRMKLLVIHLRNQKSTLEKNLLELDNAKEEYRLILHLRRELSLKNSEAESLENELNVLKAEWKDLMEEQRLSGNAEKELQLAKTVIKGLHEKMDLRKNEMQDLMKVVEERVDIIKRNVVKCNTEVKMKHAVNDAKLEVLELRRMNKELELERRVLAFKLDAAREKISTLSSTKENEVIAKFKKDLGSLGYVNQDLLKRVEKLQKQRFGMVEELVYQRWLNICLRFEAEECREISWKNSSKSSCCNHHRDLSAKSLEKTKRILHAVSESSDSSPSSMESHELDTSTSESSSSSTSRKKPTLIDRIKKWGGGKKNSDGHPPPSHKTSLSDKNASKRVRRTHRLSTTMIPESTAPLGSPEMVKSLSRLRRVSFNNTIGNSEPQLFKNRTTVSEATSVHEEPDFDMHLGDGHPSRTVETNGPKHRNLTFKDGTGGSTGSAHHSVDERNKARLQLVAEINGAWSEDVPDRTKIMQLCLVAVFIILIVITSLYFRIF